MINRAELELTMGGKITGRLGSSMSVTSKFGKATPYMPLDRPTARNDGGLRQLIAGRCNRPIH